MTTEKLIKDLKEILGLMLVEGDLQRASTVSKTIDLINHQNAEIERLTKVNAMLFQNADTAYQEGLNEAQALYACEVRGRVRAEAVKEFAKRLKQEMEDFARIDFNGSTYYGIGLHHIDNLVKEFTEGKDD